MFDYRLFQNFIKSDRLLLNNSDKKIKTFSDESVPASGEQRKRDKLTSSPRQKKKSTSSLAVVATKNE